MEKVIISSLRHLRAFQMVARHRNFRKAAETVCLTQSAVTQAVAKLEDQLGTQLFERRSYGTYTTFAGEILVSRISKMFSQIEVALQNAGSVVDLNLSLASTAERITHSQIRALSAIAAFDPQDVRECALISNASLHRAVRDLEQNTGLTLWCQTADGPSATDVGRALVRKIKGALNELELAVNEIRDASAKRTDRLRVGAMPLTGSLIVAPILNDLMRLFPDAHIEVQTAGRKALTDILRRGEIDIIVGLLCEPPDADFLVRDKLVSLPYVIVARPDHPLALKPEVEATDFSDYSWVVPNQNTVRRDAFDQFSRFLDGQPKIDIQASSSSTVRLLVAGSDRLGFLTRLEFENEKRTGGIVAIPYDPIEPSHWLGITRRPDWTPTPVQKAFIDLVHNKAARIAKAAERPRVKDGIR